MIEGLGAAPGLVLGSSDLHGLVELILDNFTSGWLDTVESDGWLL